MFLDACRMQRGVDIDDRHNSSSTASSSEVVGVHFVSVPILCDDANVGQMLCNTLKNEKNGLNPNGYSKDKFYVDFYHVEDSVFLNLTHRNVLEAEPPKIIVVACKKDDLIIEERFQVWVCVFV